MLRIIACEPALGMIPSGGFFIARHTPNPKRRKTAKGLPMAQAYAEWQEQQDRATWRADGDFIEITAIDNDNAERERRTLLTDFTETPRRGEVAAAYPRSPRANRRAGVADKPQGWLAKPPQTRNSSAGARPARTRSPRRPNRRPRRRRTGATGSRNCERRSARARRNRRPRPPSPRDSPIPTSSEPRLPNCACSKITPSERGSA